MTLVYHSGALSFGSLTPVIRVLTDGRFLVVTVKNESTGSGSATVTVTYNGQTESGWSDSFKEKTFAFTAVPNVKTVTVGMDSPGVSPSLTHTATWRGETDDPLPDVALVLDNYRTGRYFNVAWTSSGIPSGQFLMVRTVMMHVLRPNTQEAYNRLTNASPSTSSVRFDIGSPPPAESKVYYDAVFGLYPTGSSGSADDCVGFVEVITPEFVLAPQTGPLAPFGLTADRLIAGFDAAISWQPPVDTANVTGYELEMAHDGGAFAPLYSGTSCRFLCPVSGEWANAAFRVRTVGRSSGGSALYSPWAVTWAADVVASNLFVGVGGAPVAVRGLYVGRGGAAISVPPVIEVG